MQVFADDDQTTGPVDGGFPKTLTLGGAAQPAPFTFSVSRTEADGRAPDAVGWNLLGNPFAVLFD